MQHTQLTAQLGTNYVVGQCGHAFMTISIPEGYDVRRDTRTVCEILYAAFGRVINGWHRQRMEIRLTVAVRRAEGVASESEAELLSNLVCRAAANNGIPCLIPSIHWE